MQNRSEVKQPLEHMEEPKIKPEIKPETETKIETESNSDDAETVQAEVRTESRSEYQKRKRTEEKRQKRKKRKWILAIACCLVILAGILCGAVLADTIPVSHNTVEIASANVQYVRHTVANTIDRFTETLPLSQKQAVLDKLDAFYAIVTNHGETELETESKETIDVDADDWSEEKSNDTSEDLLTMPGDTQQTTTESAIGANTVDKNTATATAPENPYGIDPSKPMIALTFDDGPSKHTWTIVSALHQHNARATFFLVGERVASYEAAIDFILENNNEVANHSFSHANLAKCTEEEILSQITRVDTALQEQHDYTPTLFRVPYGERNEQVLEILKAQGKPVIGWSVDPRDWDVQDKDKIVTHVLSHVKDGDIILMHDLYQPTAEAVVELIPELQKRGYQLVTVSELFQYKGKTLMPGHYYYATWK